MAEEKGKNPKGAGKSSFDLIDLKKNSDVLPVKPGSVVLDLACGRGDYSVYFSEIVGEQGLVYALDLWEEGIKLLEKRIEKQNITNIMTLISDAARQIEIDDYCVDTCLDGHGAARFCRGWSGRSRAESGQNHPKTQRVPGCA
jgi:23S rRNA U2552 (ribose-2'-O)-methylase RlmE/FtsJ